MKKLLSLVLLCSFTLSVSALGSIDTLEPITMYTIDEPYQYPIVPSMDEWAEFNSNIDMINACMVPQSIVQHMTTGALLETYLTHPLISNIFAYDNYSEAFEIMKNYYGFGLDELMQRADLAEVVLTRYNEIDVFEEEMNTTLSIDEQLEIYETQINDSFTMMYIETLAANIDYDENNLSHIALQSAIEEKTNNKIENIEFYGATATCYYDSLPSDSAVDPMVYLVAVTTPKGNLVDAEKRELYEEWPAASLLAVMERHENCYRNATRDRPATILYNCHSYAWHNQAEGNDITIWDPSRYMTDGSYTQIATPRRNARIYYDAPVNNKNEGGVHSGIVTALNPTRVTSKWGNGGLYIHEYMHCPYVHPGNASQYQGTITYWYR